MKKYLLLVIVFIFSGCATLHKPAVETATEPAVSADVKQEPKVKFADAGEVSESQVLPQEIGRRLDGLIFGKIEFDGVLKKNYVDLLIQDVENPDKVYRLHIGGEAKKQNLIYEVKRVEPEYFFLELPQGNYKIASITIPVGTAEATERMDISFRVLPETAMYLGTLNIIGTKEKLKLGGLPVIQPGFDYEVQVFDERDTAAKVFAERFPQVSNPKKIIVELMNKNIPAHDNLL